MFVEVLALLGRQHLAHLHHIEDGFGVQLANAALDRLPRHLKEALVLTALQGLSQREAADLLGSSLKVVETRVYRARKQLAAMLDPGDFDDLSALG